MIDKDMMILQNRTNSWDSCGETSHDASQAISIKVEKVSDSEEDRISGDASEAIDIKVEKVSDAEEEEGPVPISFPKIKAEPQVRCMSLYVHCRK
jgi:hypothetical protein